MQDGVVIEYDEEIDRKSFIEECKKNTKLYKYLGMCIGAMISIILL